MNVTGFAAGHKCLGSDYVRYLTGADEFGLGQLPQVVVRRLQREFAVSGTDVCAEVLANSP